ncbi:MAG: hypothetical protein Q4C63_02835 [Eubacteriales bacterium]|nr:hypothetical protein [Eubacteriales bacterium]
MRKKSIKYGALAVLCAALTVFPAFNVSAAVSSKTTAGGTEQVRAVTYAGREWIINFWSTETEYADEDFRQIREDGFNTVILCVPWREFQPYLTGGFNEDAFAKLGTLFEKAEAADLSVMIRLGYTWDYYDNSDLLARYQSLIYDEAYQDAWKAYAKRVYETASSYRNFAGAFLTWEDFWNFIAIEKDLVGTYAGRKLAAQMGYTEYVSSRYAYEELLSLYGDEDESRTPQFPAQDSPAYRLFLEWYDAWLSDLLLQTQEVFPNLSMECRLDQDPYLVPDGTRRGFDHAATFPCGTSSYSSIMLSASMGFEEGTALSQKDTRDMSAHLIEKTKANAGKPVFVDQFLYMETTPGYEALPRLPEEEINTYLTGMGDVFRTATIGYGIWTYRDYADSLIYNPEFGLGLRGWTTYGSVSVKEEDGTKMARLSAGASLMQDLKGRNYMGREKAVISFRAVAKQSTRITVTVGDVRTVITADGDGVYTAELPRQTAGSLRISADREVLIDNVKLYSHLTEGGIYQLDGSEGPYLAGIRGLNARMCGE